MYLQVNPTRPRRWLVQISSGKGLEPSGNKPLSEPLSTNIFVAIFVCVYFSHSFQAITMTRLNFVRLYPQFLYSLTVSQTPPLQHCLHVHVATSPDRLLKYSEIFLATNIQRTCPPSGVKTIRITYNRNMPFSKLHSRRTTNGVTSKRVYVKSNTFYGIAEN